MPNLKHYTMVALAMFCGACILVSGCGSDSEGKGATSSDSAQVASASKESAPYNENADYASVFKYYDYFGTHMYDEEHKKLLEIVKQAEAGENIHVLTQKLTTTVGEEGFLAKLDPLSSLTLDENHMLPRGTWFYVGPTNGTKPADGFGAIFAVKADERTGKNILTLQHAGYFKDGKTVGDAWHINAGPILMEVTKYMLNGETGAYTAISYTSDRATLTELELIGAKNEKGARLKDLVLTDAVYSRPQIIKKITYGDGKILFFEYDKNAKILKSYDDKGNILVDAKNLKIQQKSDTLWVANADGTLSVNGKELYTGPIHFSTIGTSIPFTPDLSNKKEAVKTVDQLKKMIGNQ